MRHSSSIMFGSALVICASSRCLMTAAFVQGTQSARSSNPSKLSLSFFDELQKAFASSTAISGRSSSSSYYTVGITGSSGLLGTAIIDELGKRDTLNGKPLRIVRLKRQDTVAPSTLGDENVVTLPWNPKGTSPEEVIDPTALASIDAIVHLAGENVATGLGPLGFLGLRPWTDEKKKEILESRVVSTQGLASAIAACNTRTDLVAASGIGVYGDNYIGEDAAAVDESMDTSDVKGFLAQVSREWEAATQGCGTKNRVVIMRNGVVLSKRGGALAKLYPIFFLGGGGVVGSGQQYFSFVSARDAARAYVYALTTASLSGPVNVCAPNPCTNAEFTEAMGKVLNRPTILPLPEFAVSLLFGEMGEEMLLGGVRATPGKLTKSGFEFEDPTIEEALQSAVNENI